MYNRFSLQNEASPSIGPVSCPTPSTVVTPIGNGSSDSSSETGVLAIQNDPTLQVVGFTAAGGITIVAPALFNKIIYDSTSPYAVPVSIGLTPPNTFNALRLTTAGTYDITVGIALTGHAATPPGPITVELVKIPAGSNSPVSPPLASIISSTPLATAPGTFSSSIVVREETVQINKVPLAAGDIIQILITLPPAGNGGSVLINSTLLELEEH